MHASIHAPGRYDESIDGPYYTQLGVGASVEEVKRMMMGRLMLGNDALRLERIKFAGREGRNAQGCPVAKWVGGAKLLASMPFELSFPS